MSHVIAGAKPDPLNKKLAASNLEVGLLGKHLTSGAAIKDLSTAMPPLRPESPCRWRSCCFMRFVAFSKTRKQGAITGIKFEGVGDGAQTAEACDRT